MTGRTAGSSFGMTGALAPVAEVYATSAHADNATPKKNVDAPSDKVEKRAAEASRNLVCRRSDSGSIDPTYVDNGDLQTRVFCLDQDQSTPCTVGHSIFGNAFLAFTQLFPGQPMRDLHIGLARDEGVWAASLVNAAVPSGPITGAAPARSGQVPAWNDYEGPMVPRTLPITRAPLHDFSETSSCTSGTLTTHVLCAHPWNSAYDVLPTCSRVYGPNVAYRLAMVPFLSVRGGLYASAGAALTRTGIRRATDRIYSDWGCAYTASPVAFDRQLEYGHPRSGAVHRGETRSYGTALLGSYRVRPSMAATRRYERLNDTEQGGRAATVDSADGFWWDPAYPNVGPIRQALTGAVALYPTQETIVAVQYRHNLANIPVFVSASSNTYSKSNNTVAAQVA